MSTLEIIILIAVVAVVVIAIALFISALRGDMKDDAKMRAEQEKRKQQKEWSPKFNIEHSGVRIFNIPFTPEKTEIFYIENSYDEAANKFVKKNIEEIRKALAKKGLSFVYLPYVHVPGKEISKMIGYYCPDGNGTNADVEDVDGLRSDFLLDYMVFPKNRSNIKTAFAWYGHSDYLFKYKKEIYIFDFITFDGAEALEHPKEVLDDILPEIGRNKDFIGGLHFEIPYVPKNTLDEKFGDEKALSKEDRQRLEDIRRQLDEVRKRGITEAVIAKYVKTQPKISRMTIKYDFTIVLNDYNDMEISMEPLVKTVYIFFLRHPEGIKFKDLPDYKNEMEIIYQCVKLKRNEIDQFLASPASPQISKSVADLCNPSKNSINEKCARMKEAFVKQFHNITASHYYIHGSKFNAKLVPLSRNLITWEGKDDAV